MLEKVYQRFRGGCMMLFSQEGEEAAFLGTAFLVHESGYLLTAAHLLRRRTGLMVQPFDMAASEYVPVRSETVRPIGVSVAQKDAERDLALLRFEEEIDITAPDHILGRAHEVPVGIPLACLGYPFGDKGLYNPAIFGASLSSKILTPRQNRILLFDSRVFDGMRGGPLVNLQDGRVVGIVCGLFHAWDVTGEGEEEPAVTYGTNLSFAVAVEYGRSLLEAEGLEST